jgi:hypothetical protein
MGDRFKGTLSVPRVWPLGASNGDKAARRNKSDGGIDSFITKTPISINNAEDKF